MTIKFINKESVVWDDEEAEVAKIWELIPCFSKIVFSHVPRNCNRAADVVAKVARSSGVSTSWMGQFPSWLCNVVQLDISNSAHVA